MIPKVEFEVSEAVNEFCHFSVLYADLMPVELATGMLGNRAYQERNHHLIQDPIRLELQRSKPFSSEAEWYSFTTGLMKPSESEGLRLTDQGRLWEWYRDHYPPATIGFSDIWAETRPKLEDYKSKFASQWSTISDRVLSNLSRLAGTRWQTDKIHVHFIDCLYGGFGWDNCIGFAALPDMAVQRKFIAHELSELITPQHIVRDELQKANLDLGITHTVVDMLAYLSIREFLAQPDGTNLEKKGVKPNPNYYPEAAVLLPIFERYAEEPMAYPDFAGFIQDMTHSLKHVS